MSSFEGGPPPVEMLFETFHEDAEVTRPAARRCKIVEEDFQGVAVMREGDLGLVVRESDLLKA